jgi:Rrf2 family transcriptional regulator, cysteine metabolism repressor
MNFSTKTEYGLRAISKLDKAGKKPVSLALIAKQECLSLAYLERLFSLLKKADIVKSVLGVKGGYILTKPATKFNALEVVETLDGKLLPYACVGDSKCSHKSQCKIHPVWDKLYFEVRKTLKNIKLNTIM